MPKITEIVKNIIIINVIVYFGTVTLPDAFSSYANLGAMYFFKSPFFRPFQLVTSMFMHANFMHLAMNMLGLYFLGPIVERVLGPKKFLLLYFAAGIGGNILHQIYQYVQYLNVECVSCLPMKYLLSIPALGASGAIYGVVIGFITMFPNQKLMIIPIPIPIKASIIGLGMVGIALFFGLTDNDPGGYAHFAHLGGALVGFLLINIWGKRNLG